VGFFYFDESLHPKAKFALGVFVYSEECLDDRVSEALTESGLRPGIDEYKSGTLIDLNPKLLSARNPLKSAVCNYCGIGVVIASAVPRHLLGQEAQYGLKKILSTISFRSTSHEVFFDEGIFPSLLAAEQAVKKVPEHCKFRFEQNSKRVLGLQVADLVAHMCATMLLGELGFVRKTVKAGDKSGYEPELDIDLVFELWATLRFQFFAGPPPPVDDWKSQLDFKVDVESCGLHVAEGCEKAVLDSAIARFGKMYLGCIH
jgi:hypothetical protein